MHRTLFKQLAGMAAVGLLTVVAGCNPTPTEGIIRGTVTLDGQPLKTGSVQLTAVDGRAPTAGAQIVDGKFETKAALTKFKVEIESNVIRTLDGKEIDPNKKVDKINDSNQKSVPLVPDRYNKKTELTIDVQPGVQEPKYELTSK
jgi:hypothetical protein